MALMFAKVWNYNSEKNSKDEQKKWRGIKKTTNMKE